MDPLPSNSHPHSPITTSRFLEIGINPCIGKIRCTTIDEGRNRGRTKFKSDRDSELSVARDIYRQERLVEHEKRQAQAASNSEYSRALDIKRCVLDVQKLCSKDLAAEENHVKGLARIPGATTIDLEKNRKEVERIINVLHCRERRPDNHSDGL